MHEQPPIGDPITFEDLASELGRTHHELDALCTAQQVYVGGLDYEITARNANRLREAHADRIRREPRMRLLTDIARSHSGPNAHLLEWTEDHHFTPDQAEAWQAAGLNLRDCAAAAAFRDVGVQPEHMGIHVRGDTMLDRWERGMAPEEIARVLRDQGIL